MLRPEWPKNSFRIGPLCSFKMRSSTTSYSACFQCIIHRVMGRFMASSTFFFGVAVWLKNIQKLVQTLSRHTWRDENTTEVFHIKFFFLNNLSLSFNLHGKHGLVSTIWAPQFPIPDSNLADMMSIGLLFRSFRVNKFFFSFSMGRCRQYQQLVD